MTDTRVYCACCARQIVDYAVDPASDGCLSLGFGKYACPKCKSDEQEWQAMQEAEGVHHAS